MASCATCKRTILFGGVTDGGVRYCSTRCHQAGMMAIASEVVEPDLLNEAVGNVHAGPCPQCNGPGPVDIHTSHFVWSILVLTSWKDTPKLSCRKCARQRQLTCLLGSAAVGWWGFPFGLILTPVQIIRNIVGMVGGPSDAQPSVQLQQMVKTNMGAQLLAMARQEAAATTGSLPAPAPPNEPTGQSPGSSSSRSR